MHIAPAVALLGLSLTSDALELGRRASLGSCLVDSNVPLDVEGSDAWQEDASPYNLRLQYRPAAIAVPTTTRHIQDAIACAVRAGVKTNAKCGGHSYGSFGLGGEDDHLVIEMDRMDKVTLDNVTGVAIVQGGSRLGHVASELYAQGRRGFSHGTCPGVGVGGHTLHGGYGVSSHTKGLALDWMTGATVVLANSTVVNCSESEHPDLFWALRGAGSSMGIVSSFTFKTFEVPAQLTYFAASARWSQEKALTGLKSLQDFALDQMPAELNMRLFITRTFTNLEGLYYGGQTDLQSVLQPLLNRTGATLSVVQTGDWLDQLTHFGNGMSLNQTYPYNMHETFYSSSLYTKSLTDSQLRGFVDYWFTSGKSNTRDWYAQIDLHGGKTSAVASISANTTAYAHRDFLFLFNWYDRVDKGAYPDSAFSFIQGFVSNLTSNMAPRSWGQYINYPDPNLNQTAAQDAYWGAHLKRLQDVKKTVDPGDLFHFPQGVLPLHQPGIGRDDFAGISR